METRQAAFILYHDTAARVLDPYAAVVLYLPACVSSSHPMAPNLHIRSSLS